MDDLKFRNLNISTITINVESNIFFSLSHVMNAFLNFDSSETTLLKQQKELSHSDYKNQIHPKGTVSYICYKNVWWGLKRKKKRLLKKRNDFVNQVTLDVFVDTNRRINVMLFKNGRIKLAGCKTSNDAVIAVMNIYEFLKNKDRCIIFQTENSNTTFIFRNEMINISFSFPSTINKIKVNKIFNLFKDCISFYEQTGQQYVNVKMLSDSNQKKGIKVELPNELDSCITKHSHACMNCIGVQPKISIVNISVTRPMKTCFMLFEKRVIMSGVDYCLMENHFTQFLKILSDQNVFL